MINRPLKEQSEKLLEIILTNPNVNKILNGEPFPNTISWYLSAGCIHQSVWNYLSGKNIQENIDDYDLVYYNSQDIRKEAEVAEQKRISKLFSALDVQIEVVNQARVHTWFEKDFGMKIDQLKSCEDAINRWPTTATTTGVTKIGSEYSIYAPYGLNDLFAMVVKPNKPYAIKKEFYEKKVQKWTKKWPNLKVISWEQV